MLNITLGSIMAALAAFVVEPIKAVGSVAPWQEAGADWTFDTLNRALARGRDSVAAPFRRAALSIRASFCRALASETGALNERKIPLETVNYATNEQTIDLEPNVATERLDMVLSGAMTVTGANADGAVYDDASERLIDRIRVYKDNLLLVDSDLRGIYQDYLRNVSQAATRDDLTTAEVDGAGTYDFRLPFSVYFSSPFTRRPYDTHLPAMPVRNSLRIVVNWASDAENSSSDAGTGAMLSAGSDAYTFSTSPTLDVIQVTVPREGIQPLAIPVFESFDVDTWAAAVSQLTAKFNNDRRFTRMILRNTYGTEALLEDAINTIRLSAVGQDWIRDVKLAIMRDADQAFHPGIGDQTGWLGVDFTSGGLIGGAVNPKQHSDLKLVFDVDAPTSGNGLIRVYQRQLIGVQGLTKLPPQ